MLCFGVVAYIFTIPTMTSDVINVADLINESAKIKENQSQTLIHLSEFIKFYSDRKQLRY